MASAAIQRNSETLSLYPATDLVGAESIGAEHVAEAIPHRSLDRALWQ